MSLILYKKVDIRLTCSMPGRAPNCQCGALSAAATSATLTQTSDAKALAVPCSNIKSSVLKVAKTTPLVLHYWIDAQKTITLMKTVSCTVNGRAVSVNVEERTLLADALRDELHLTGTHVGCDTSQCGCCTVQLNGSAVKSCTMLAVQAQNAEITTIEGLATGDNLHPVQLAFSACHGLQCGFCTPGMIMATIELLDQIPNPSDEQIREGLSGNLCRCTGYINIEAAVRAAASAMQVAESTQTHTGRARGEI